MEHVTEKIKYAASRPVVGRLYLQYLPVRLTGKEVKDLLISDTELTSKGKLCKLLTSQIGSGPPQQAH